MSNSLMMISLSKLRRSKVNVRKTNRLENLDELAASIVAHGLLQNLTVQPFGKPNGELPEAYEVVAGGRRLAALKMLVKRKKLAKDHEVPCQVLAHENTGEVSLAENTVRAQLHPADQFEAFLKLSKEGLGAEEIAARFGVTPAIVCQRLKLAAVSPALIEIYRKSDMTLEQLMAFTVSDDHEAQKNVWFHGPPWDVHPGGIRRALTKAHVDGNDRRARFIGHKAYKAAGGTITRDLFCPEDGGYFTDSQLLDQLVAEKLDKEAAMVAGEGWAWVEAAPEVDYERFARFGRVYPADVPLSKKDQARANRLAKRYDKLIENLDEDVPDDISQELDTINQELETFAEKQSQWDDEDKKRSGALVSLEHDGTVTLNRGLVRPEDRKGKETKGTEPNDSKSGKTGLPDTLIENLSMHKTAALREVLAGSPEVALTALLHALALKTFFDPHAETCVDVRPVMIELRSPSERIDESKAVTAFAKRHEKWRAKLPKEGKLWEWLATQPRKTRLELLAFCIGRTVNAVRRRHDNAESDRFVQAEILSEALSLDMAEWWDVTAESYLSRVTRENIFDAVSEGVSPEAAENISRLKKPEMVERANERLNGTRWLPVPLRAKANPSGDDAKVTTAANASA